MVKYAYYLYSASREKFVGVDKDGNFFPTVIDTAQDWMSFDLACKTGDKVAQEWFESIIVMRAIEKRKAA